MQQLTVGKKWGLHYEAITYIAGDSLLLVFDPRSHYPVTQRRMPEAWNPTAHGCGKLKTLLSTQTNFDVHRAVHHNIISIVKPTRCTNVSDYFILE